MRGLMRGLGIVLFVCGLLLYAISGEGVEASQPYEVKSGVVINGKVTYTDSGYIGGNKKAEDNFESLQSFGTIAMIGGACVFIISFFVRRPEDSPYI